jgi:hypothetical protein
MGHDRVRIDGADRAWDHVIITKIAPRGTLVLPDATNSNGMPGLDWGIVPTGGTNGEAATNDFPDINFNTFLRRTGNLGSSTTYAGNLRTIPTPSVINFNGWVFYFTTRTSFNMGSMFIHLRSGASPIITRRVGAPNDPVTPDFRATPQGNTFVMPLTPAEAANLVFPGQPWKVSMDFSGIDEAQTWDWSAFKLFVPQ